MVVVSLPAGKDAAHLVYLSGNIDDVSKKDLMRRAYLAVYRGASHHWSEERFRTLVLALKMMVSSSLISPSLRKLMIERPEEAI